MLESYEKEIQKSLLLSWMKHFSTTESVTTDRVNPETTETDPSKFTRETGFQEQVFSPASKPSDHTVHRIQTDVIKSYTHFTRFMLSLY